jgi:hypothetical protein
MVCYVQLTGHLPLTKERALLKEMVKEADPTNTLSQCEAIDMTPGEQFHSKIL